MSMDGIILINKPLHITSYQVIRQLKLILGPHKYGHTGTLDPLASGMLPICVNRATKVASLFTQGCKVYTAEMQLGATTHTGDSESALQHISFVTEEHLGRLASAMRAFQGVIWQTPPMYSAIKIKGQKLYQLARRNQYVAVPARPIHIYALHLLALNRSSYTIRMRIHCSKGTYIRTLVEDIGKFLGCGAYLRSLHRHTVSNINDAHMITLAALEQLPPAERLLHIHPVSAFFTDIPQVFLEEHEAEALLRGSYLPKDPGLRKYYYQENFLGLLERQQQLITFKYLCLTRSP
jgi:tRNA pseudouridine55 synthase